MASGISSFTRLLLVFCAVTYVAGQYSVDSTSVPKKSLQNPPRRFKTQSARFSGTPTTILTNPRLRKPIAISKPISRASEPVPELPVFTSGIRGSNKGPFSIPLAYEQNDDASAQPIHHHQQSYHPPTLQEVKPVSEEQEKDEDIVQVLGSIGNSYPNSYSLGNHLLSSTASPIYSSSTGLPTAYPQILQHPLDAIQYRPAPHFQPSRPLHQVSAVNSQVLSSSTQATPSTTSTTQVVPTIVSPQPQVSSRQQHHQQQHQQQYLRQSQKPSKSHQHHQHHHQKSTLAPPAERNEFEAPSEAGKHIAKARAQLTPKKAKQEYYEGGGGRPKKPVAQVIRRYREETADGSIIWGFENDDGSFKEEIIGIDCITRGKYGYVDPDGVRREYTYETGIKCDEEAQQKDDQDILNTFVDYQENKLVLPSGKTIDLSSMGKKQARRPNYRQN